MSKLLGWDDTIVALATPQGVGAIGVIRVSGKDAIDIVNKLFPKKNLLKQPSHTLHVGILYSSENTNNPTPLDEVVLSLFKAPKSYTGENVVEISCHGSAFIQQKIIETLTQNGCRVAKAGEFTQRAFLNGKLDLTQAEAVADLIASNTEASKNNALKNIRGGFSNELNLLREELLKFSALIELELDFSEEDVEFADRTQFKVLIAKIKTATHTLLHSFKLGNVIKNGVQVAIIGKPNAGKSTLLNALLNEQRAIVSDIAGTTRDTIEEIINIDGVLFRLIDTAGIREHTNDEIETIGVGKSFEKANLADIILYLFDSNIEPNIAEAKQWLQQFNKPYILVGNKIDEAEIELSNNTEEVIYISAKNNYQIDVLKKMLHQKMVTENINTSSTIITNARHYEALEHLHNSLLEIEDGLSNNLPGDLLALDIRKALHYLGNITGEITNEDQLDYIFSKFCIGK